MKVWQLIIQQRNDKNGMIYITAWDLFAINSDGSIKWRFETDGTPNGTPALAEDGTIYLTARYFYAVNSNGTLKRRSEYGGNISALLSPTISNDGTIYIGTYSRLKAICGSSKLAEAQWPMFHHDVKNTGFQHIFQRDPNSIMLSRKYHYYCLN